MRHKRCVMADRGIDNPENWAPLDDASFVRVYTIERLKKMIGDRNPEVRKNGVVMLCDKLNIMATLVEKEKDSNWEYEEFRKSVSELIGVISGKNNEFGKMAIENIRSIELLEALPAFPDVTEEAKRDICKRIEKLKSED